MSGADNSMSAAYPELAEPLLRRCPPGGMLLDGTLVARGEEHAVRPRLLKRRSARHRPSDATIPRIPVDLQVADLLWLDGHSTVDLPYSDRRAARRPGLREPARLDDLPAAGHRAGDDARDRRAEGRRRAARPAPAGALPPGRTVAVLDPGADEGHAAGARRRVDACRPAPARERRVTPARRPGRRGAALRRARGRVGGAAPPARSAAAGQAARGVAVRRDGAGRRGTERGVGGAGARGPRGVHRLDRRRPDAPADVARPAGGGRGAGRSLGAPARGGDGRAPAGRSCRERAGTGALGRRGHPRARARTGATRPRRAGPQARAALRLQRAQHDRRAHPVRPGQGP
jgi:hypothetical protein